MKSYLDCWIEAATTLFSQALAGEPELAESLPKPMAAAPSALPPPSPETRRAALRDSGFRDSGNAAGGRRRGSEGRLGRDLREVANAAAGELLAKTGKKCRIEKFEEIAGESKVSAPSS
jgi:hypothetical protein